MKLYFMTVVGMCLWASYKQTTQINKINTFTRSLTVCHEKKMNTETKSAPNREAGENHIQTFACMRVADGAMNAAGTHRNNRPHS